MMVNPSGRSRDYQSGSAQRSGSDVIDMTAKPASTSWVQRFRLALSRLAEGKSGDFGLLKADLFGAPTPPDLRQKLADVAAYRPRVDLEQLSTYTEGTFGRHYADWMSGRGLSPIEISDDLSEVAARNIYYLRYAQTHDIVHVLTGFDTSLAGEIGVLAFGVGQYPLKSQIFGLKVASVVYPLLRPWKAAEIRAARDQGHRMGTASQFLLGERLEEHFGKPIEDVRLRLNIVI